MQPTEAEKEPLVLTDTDKSNISAKMSSVLLAIQEQNAADAEAERKRQEYDAAELAGRCDVIYADCLAVAATTGQAELLTTYIQSMYGADTVLDVPNRFVNLIFLRNLLRFSVMTFTFTEEPRDAVVDDPRLQGDSWKALMEDEGSSTPEKYMRVADKWLRAMFYSTLFAKLHKAADLGTYNSTLYKRDLITTDEEDFSFEKGVVNYVRNRSTEGAVIISSRSTTKFFDYNDDTADYEPADAYHKGAWHGRVLQQYDPASLLYMKNVKSSVYVIHKGANQNNLLTIDPRKPLVYFTVLDNPMVTKPQMLTYLNVDFDFLNTATVNITLDDAV